MIIANTTGNTGTGRVEDCHDIKISPFLPSFLEVGRPTYH